MIKIGLLSDTHTYHRDIIIPEDLDLFIFAGDFSDRGEIYQVVDFLEWLRSLKCKNIVWIAGNHDLTTDKSLMLNPSQGSIESLLNRQKYYEVKHLIKELPPHIHYLENSSVEIEGFIIWGSPISPTFGYNWAWNVDRGEEIRKIWSKIPKDTNILVTHTPPYGIGDLIPDRYKRYPGEDVHVGCKDLLERIKRLYKLQLHVAGHIHHQWGIRQEAVSNGRNVLFANAACLNNDYKLLTKYPHILYL